MTSDYRWGPARFSVPKSVEDESVLSFVEYDQDRAVASLTATCDEYEGELQEFVDTTDAEIRETFPGWTATVHTDDPEIIATTHVGVSPAGEQCLARSFRKCGTRVYCFTALGARERDAQLLEWVTQSATSLVVD